MLKLNKNTFTRKGYTFAGWNTKANGSGASYGDQESVKNLASAGGSITLYAQWTTNYTVKFDKNGGTGSMDDQSIAMGTATRLRANKFKRAGYAFAGWDTKANGTGKHYTDYQQVTDIAPAAGEITLYAQWSTTMPMYRLYNPNSGEHFYTGSEAERVMVYEAGWRYEGIGWTAPASSSEPVYRAYNPNAKTGAHNFTSDINEQNHIVSLGWRNEGIGWYGVK